MELREQIIKLAHERPELRQHIVPLLRKTSGDKLKLVEMASVTSPTGKIVAVGTQATLLGFAQAQGLKWRPQRALLFGGYWVNQDGDAYMPDLALPGDRVGKQAPIPGGV